uniref:MFS domain-containing protein n=1 Tax=Caenorhabditis tropicalis TaxID=1561998 RepID=A0A1I7T3B0_9PELO
MRIRKVDDVFELDSYQLVVLGFNEFLIFTMLSNVVFNMFGAAAPRVPGCDDIIYNATSPFQQCEEYDLHLDCLNPIMKYEFKSVPVEFEELCSRHNQESYMDTVTQLFGVNNRVRFSTTSQMIGIMIGSAIAGQLSDLYGRKNVGCIFVVENLPSDHRLWMSTVVTWAPNYMLFALFAYITGEWRCLARMSNVMTIVAILICAFLLPESPKYLIQARKGKMAVKSIKYINKFKKIRNQLTDDEIESIVHGAIEADAKSRAKAKKYSFIHLYIHPKITIQTVVASISMFSVSYVTYGLLFNYDVLTGSIYMNAAVSGFLRYVVGAVVAVLDHFGGKHVGRKRMHFITVSFIMCCMFGIFYIYFNDMVLEYKTWIRALTLLAFGTTGCLFLQLLLITAEMFPTGIRNIASAHINVCGRLGNVFGPMVFSYKLGFAGSGYFILGIICLLDVIVFQIFIPETKNQPLPQAMPSKKKKQKRDPEVALMTISEEPEV